MEFKVGDKVKVIKSNNTAVWFDVSVETLVGEVTSINEDLADRYYVKIDGHVGIYDNGWFAFRDEHLQLYEQQDKNYRHLSPDTLIPISIDGVESEVPLGDLVHATALVGEANGEYGYLLYKTLNDQFDSDSIVFELNTYPNNDVSEAQQKLLAKYFIDPKKEQQKEDIKKTILAKETELKELQNQLKELD